MDEHRNDHDHEHQPGRHQHGHGESDDAAPLAEMLDLDAEVLHAYLTEVVDWVHGLVKDPSHPRILDLGTGTGTGALALARRFPGGEVTALDLSPELLDRLADKARALGLAERIRPLRADLDHAWPGLGALDLVWAANSLHHMGDPDRVLDEVFAAVRPGGLLALLELDSFPRFLPQDLGLGRPGLEERCHAAMADHHHEEVPHLGADWTGNLVRAGFTIEERRDFSIDLSAPLPEAAGRYAQATIRRFRTGLADRLDADDLAVLDALLAEDGPDSILRRTDLGVRTRRTVWAARRP